jgi:hypothetical protein
VETEDDVLDLIRALPEEINNSGTTTEFKFLTVGSVLWQCYHEIKNLREENFQLKNRMSRRKQHGKYNNENPNHTIDGRA